MAEATTIKEFLVKLGFITDEPAMKKFKDGIGEATKAVMALGVAVGGMATSLFLGIEKFSNNLERLYFVSKRTGDSATNLAAFSLAARNFGVSSEEALGAAESLATFLRTTYGASVLGISTTDKQGRALTDTQLLINLGKHWAGMSTQLGSQYAAMIGVSQPLFLALRNGEFAAQVERTRQALGPGFEAATESAHRFMNSLRWLGIALEAFGAKVEIALAKKLGLSLDKISLWFQHNGTWLASKLVDIIGRIIDACNSFLDWVDAHTPEIKKNLGTVFDDFLRAYQILKPALTWLWQKFADLDEATGGWSTTIIVLVGALKTLGLLDIGSAVIRLTAAFITLGGSAAALAPLSAELAIIGGAIAAILAAYQIGKYAEDQFDISGIIHDTLTSFPNGPKSLGGAAWHDWSGTIPNASAAPSVPPLGSSNLPRGFGIKTMEQGGWGGGNTVDARTNIEINASGAPEAFKQAFAQWKTAQENALRGLITPII